MREHGVTISAWADRRGFSRTMTYAVLSGRVRGLRGEAYEIARALGLVVPPAAADCPWITQEELEEKTRRG